MMALLILGAAYTVSTLHQTSVEAVRPRTELERLVGDGLTVLAGLDDGNGTALLDLYLAQAIHCAKDVVPDPDDCDGTRAKNLSLKLETYLPLGAGYAVGLGNGAAVQEIFRLHQPQGEAVSTSHSMGLEWNLTFIASELSCYENGMDANFTLVPIDRGALAWARYANVTIGATEIAGERADTGRWWNATHLVGTAGATVVTNTTGNATLPGATAYGSCDLGTFASTVRSTLDGMSFTSAAPNVSLGSSLRFDADLSPLDGLLGVTIGDASVTLYEPVPPQGSTPDTWIEASRVELTGVLQRSGTWQVAGHTLYGAHPALLRVPITVVEGAVETNVELRKLLVVDVGLPTDDVPLIPIDAPYRVTVQAWMPDWG